MGRNGNQGRPRQDFTILLVDDDLDQLEKRRSRLESAGFSVIAVSHSGRALDVLDSDRPIDLLMTDVHMPGMPHGFSLARMAKARRPGLPIVYVDGTIPDTERKFALGPIANHPDAEALIDLARRTIVGSKGAS